MTKHLKIALSAALILAAAGVGAVHAADEKTPTVDEIVQRTNFVSYYQGADGRAKVSMTIVDKNKNKRTREMTILRWDAPGKGVKDADRKADRATGEQKFYVYFRQPADVNKMAFLVHKHLDKPDDRWLYVPGIDHVSRISSADKRTSFVGSHFLYEDISGRNINDDTHELTKTTKSYYVLKNTPKDAKSVEFGHYEMWIHRTTFLVVKTDYYDKKGEKYRSYQALQVQTIQGNKTVTKARMTDHRDGSYTELEYPEIVYDIGIPESTFTEPRLRKPPMEYLK